MLRRDEREERRAVSDRPRTTCPTCGEVIEPDEPNVIEAAEIVSTPGMGAGRGDAAEGMTAVFHEACFPVDHPNYRRV